MRTRKAIEERFHTLTQAYYFSYAHRKELSDEALAKHRALEENISLLRWCLKTPDPQELTWQNVREAFAWAFGLFARKLFGRFRKTDFQSPQDAAHSSVSKPREVTR